MNESKVHYGYVNFTFSWTWIKDKQIGFQGDMYSGMLLILDRDDNIVKMYGYELDSETDKEE